ncbi:MAG: type II toxin-antitoxin system RelE/ParE family toxin [Bacteroides sp.]|nr:type II toxin-antitoxin system RelE/ParE family toxin [Bacteroides sp.]
MKYREVITYKHYFEDFFKKQSPKVRDKIIKVLDIIEQIDRIPITYLKYIEGTNGLFEIRVQLGSNIFRIFCFFDGNKLVVLLSGFQKKTQKTPPDEIRKAERLMSDYYEEKRKEQ